MKVFLQIFGCTAIVAALLFSFSACDDHGNDTESGEKIESVSESETSYTVSEDEITSNVESSDKTETSSSETETENDMGTETETTVESDSEIETESSSSDNIECAHVTSILSEVTPTCTATGLSEGLYCTLCNVILVEQTELDRLPHELVAVEAKAPSCFEEGYEAYEYCALCNYTTKVIIPADHLIVKGDDKPASCFEDGYTDYEYCTRCDYSTSTVISASHSLVEVSGQPESCTEDGWYDYVYCSNCDYTTKVIISAAHNIISGPSKEPTCFEDGYYDYNYCTRCDYATFIPIPSNHSLVFVDEEPATCAKEGHYPHSYCENCDYSTIEIMPMLEHSLIPVDEVSPTCQNTGTSAHEKCVNCDYSTATVLPITDHKFDDIWHDDVTATLQNAGVRSHHCTFGCGERSDITEYVYEYYTEGLEFTLLSTGTYKVSAGTSGVCDVVIPSTYLGIPVTHVGKFGAVKSISLPEGITHITSGAFYNARIETGSIKFPSTLQSIESFAFNYSGLHTVDFGASMPYVSYDAFGSVLNSVYVDSIETWYNICNGGFTILQAHGHLYVGGVLAEGEVRPPEGATTIPSYAYTNQLHVTSLVIPKTVKTFSASAVYDSGIKSVYYEGTLEEWEKMTVYGMDNPKNWDGVALYVNGELYKQFDPLFSDPGEDNDELVSSMGQGEFVYDGVHSYDIVDGVYIYRSYIGDTSSGVVVLPETIDGHRYNLGREAFLNCDWLVSLTVRGVDNIGDGAISGCDNLTELILDEGIAYIGAKAFACNLALTTVTLPKSVKFMVIDLFYGCLSLKEIIFLETEGWHIGSDLYVSYWHLCPECITKTLTRGDWGRYPDARNMFIDASVIPDGDAWC